MLCIGYLRNRSNGSSYRKIHSSYQPCLALLDRVWQNVLKECLSARVSTPSYSTFILNVVHTFLSEPLKMAIGHRQVQLTVIKCLSAAFWASCYCMFISNVVHTVTPGTAHLRSPCFHISTATPRTTIKIYRWQLHAMIVYSLFHT